MTMIVFSVDPNAHTPEKIKSTLIVSRDMSESEDGTGFIYRFTENEIVTDKPTHLLEINLESRLPCDYEAYIHSFVRTHQTLVRPVPGTKLTGGCFELKTQTTTFELNMKMHEFVFLGIIVGIKKPGEDEKYKYILCDPQVGNGPPNTNGGRSAVYLS